MFLSLTYVFLILGHICLDTPFLCVLGYYMQICLTELWIKSILRIAWMKMTIKGLTRGSLYDYEMV